VPDLAEVLAGHSAWLRLKGRSEGTIYARERTITRLAAWLAARGGTAGRDLHPHTLLLSAAPWDPAAVSQSLLHATAADLRAWRASLAVGDSAVITYANHVRELYAWLAAEGLRADNPADGLPLPRAPKGLPRPVSEDDLMRALDYATPRVRPWLVLAGWAGLRAKEIAYLRRESLFETAQPPVLLIAEDATKGRRERIVPASRFVLAELQLAGLPAKGFMFPRHDGRPGPNRPWIVSGLANDCLHDSGCTASLHQLRHRFLTMCYRETKDLRLVQDLAGHSSPNSTAGYAAFDRSEAVMAVERLAVPPRLRVLPRKEAT
jgi:integrase